MGQAFLVEEVPGRERERFLRVGGVLLRPLMGFQPTDLGVVVVPVLVPVRVQRPGRNFRLNPASSCVDPEVVEVVALTCLEVRHTVRRADDPDAPFAPAAG
jgi:hypothetical protein